MKQDDPVAPEGCQAKFVGGPFDGVIAPLRVLHQEVVRADLSKGRPVWAWYVKRTKKSNHLYEYTYDRAEIGEWPKEGFCGEKEEA